METLVIFLAFLALMTLGIPIGTSLGISAVITVYYFDLGIAMLGKKKPLKTWLLIQAQSFKFFPIGSPCNLVFPNFYRQCG